ncbi:MAG: cytochrome c [Nitrospira sp.]|nr:cytochrome c [Nitrospira sp.]MCP9443189.1 cytochrome c [Nitrospira sp.]
MCGREGWLVLVVGILVAGFAGGPKVKELGSAEKGDPVSGREIYVNVCSRCHGVDGKGVRGIRLVSPPADLTSADVQGRLDGALFKRIHEGKPNTPMGAWQHALSDEEIWDVVAYLRTLGAESDANP